MVERSGGSRFGRGLFFFWNRRTGAGDRAIAQRREEIQNYIDEIYRNLTAKLKSLEEILRRRAPGAAKRQDPGGDEIEAL
jgi:hypothetical protein